MRTIVRESPWAVLCACAALFACGGGGEESDVPADTGGDVTDVDGADGGADDAGVPDVEPEDGGAEDVATPDGDGNDGEEDDGGAGDGEDGDGDGAVPDCTESTWADDCPDRACEEATGCDAGTCVYAAVDCSGETACPVRECQATEVSGGWENACVEVPFGTCETCAGMVCGVCIAEICLAVGPTATFVTTSQTSGTSTISVTGNVEQFLPAAGRRCAGTVCVTGGLVP